VAEKKAPATAPSAGSEAWVLVWIGLSAGQASLRVAVWRKLRSLGALPVQSSVYLLPERPLVVREVRRLLDRVAREGGTGHSLRIAMVEPAEQAGLIEELNAARDEEYREVLERLPSFRAEIAAERARGRASYAEVEESEADLDRFRAWLAKIDARDYYAAPTGADARAELERCAGVLADFEAEALQAEAPPLPVGRRLRAVRGGRPAGDDAAGSG